MRALSNMIGYQVVWLLAVSGAAHGSAWIGLGAALAFAAWQLAVSHQRGLELRLMAAALMLGTVVDGALAASGALRYAAASPAIPYLGAPVWILALWAAFSLTLTQSLAWLQKRPIAALVFGVVGGPLAYLGAARGWHAVEFAVPAWRATIGLAIGWGAAITLLLHLIGRWSGAAVQPAPRLHRRSA